MIIVDGLEPIAGRKIQFDAAAAAAWSAPALTRDTRPWRGHGDTVRRENSIKYPAISSLNTSQMLLICTTTSR